MSVFVSFDYMLDAIDKLYVMFLEDPPRRSSRSRTVRSAAELLGLSQSSNEDEDGVEQRRGVKRRAYNDSHDNEGEEDGVGGIEYAENDAIPVMVENENTITTYVENVGEEASEVEEVILKSVPDITVGPEEVVIAVDESHDVAEEIVQMFVEDEEDPTTKVIS